MKALIAIIIIVGLAAIAGPIIFGIKSFDGTVTENAYEKGLVWDDLQKKKTGLGWNVQIGGGKLRTGDNDMIIYTNDRDGSPLSGSSISVMIARPGISRYDRDVDSVKLKEGIYRVKVNFPVYGYWDVIIEVTNENNNLSFTKRIYVEKRG
jgi:nitrogen fixation protein FixH